MFLNQLSKSLRTIKKKLGLKKIKNNHLSMGLVLFMLLMLFCEKPGFKEGIDIGFVDFAAAKSKAKNLGKREEIAINSLRLSGKQGEGGFEEGEVITCVCEESGVMEDPNWKANITATGDFHKLTDEEPERPLNAWAIGSAKVTCDNVICTVQCENKDKCDHLYNNGVRIVDTEQE